MNKAVTIDNNNRLRLNTLAIRLLLFFVIVNSLLIAMHVCGKTYIHDFHEYMTVQLLLIIAIAYLMYKDSGKLLFRARPRIDKLALLTCTGLAAYTILSDLLVDKSFRFAGIGLFFALLTLGCAWTSNAAKRDQYIKDFEVAVQLFLVTIILLTIVFRDEIPDGRLSGPIANPSIFALYLGGIWAVLVGSIEHHIIFKSSCLKKCVTLLELSATLVLALLSQSLTPLIAMCAVLLLCVFRLVDKKKGRKKALIQLAAMCISGLVALILLIMLARSSGLEIASRLLSKFQAADLSVFLSDRDYYWRVYLRKMNLFGHHKKPFLWGMRINPHNAIIGMAYMYGVPCILPYILMLMMALEKSYKYAEGNTPYAAIPLYAIVTFVIMGLTDNVEQPLVWLPTISGYLLMAPILCIPVEDIKNVEKEDGSCFRIMRKKI